MWLYVPGTSSPCAQESEDLNSASSLPSSIGERLAAAYATWRGKLQPPQAWSRRWKQGGFIQRLSGLTCEPSTLDRGVEQFISSLRATPARTTPSPESAPGQMASASLPPKSPALPKSAGLVLSSARTSRGTRTNSSPPSLHHWKGWATALRQEYSARPGLATPCDASDCSSWPSAKTATGGWERDPKTGKKVLTLQGAAVEWAGPLATERAHSARQVDHGIQLANQAESWSSPKASDPEKAGPNMRGSKGDVPLPGQAAQWEAPSVAVRNGTRMTRSGDRSDELLLTGQAMDASKRWAAPAAQNHKGSSEGSITRSDGKSREGILSYQAEQFFRPPSSPDQPIAGGSMSSTDSPNSNQPSVKRKLNPIFVEALMRWPTGLSGFERQETAWTRWRHVQLSFLSALYSASEVPAEQYDMFGAAA